ncbi:alpha/beta fold hydrolase [Sinosporangium siamense]|uniref:Protease n=1 Tax=Sinosporangium siamense TaxID=1367973 RepID=A0A919V855_9ACTN|nr:alpha/beta fold hydrolase [Sinosporangium siamense]GII95805.1 protease [Sinosporangium siamense]
MAKTLTGILAASAIGLTTFTALAPSAAAESAPAWCPEIPGHKVECDTLDRPLVEGKPELGTTPVGYAMVRRTQLGKPAAGTVMVNPGGPGSSTLEMAAQYTALLAPALTDHDLLLISPRGTAESGPLKCGASDPVGFESVDAVAKCAEELGAKAAGYTSANIAGDFNAVRAKAGVDKVVLYRKSYGTYLMSIYAQRHPETVRSIVLSGGIPLKSDPFWRASAQAASDSLRLACQRSRACDGAQAVQDLKKVAARMRAKPLRVPITAGGKQQILNFGESRLSILVVNDASRMTGADPTAVPTLGYVPAALAASAKGDDGKLKQLITGIYGGGGAVEEDSSALFIAVSCNDYLKPWSAEATAGQRVRQYHQAIDAARGQFGAFSAKGHAYATIEAMCGKWPAKGTARPYISTGHFPDVPVLAIAADLDATTSVAATREVAEQYKRSTFLRVPNMGHVAEYDPSGCVTGISSDFIRHGKVGDTSCLKEIPPIKVTPVK